MAPPRRPRPRRSRRPRPRPAAVALRLLALAGVAGVLLLRPGTPSRGPVADAAATHRFASSLAQRREPSLAAAADATPAMRRRLDGQYAADDQYVNAGAANYDDDAVAAAMDAQQQAGDDGYLALDDVDFGEVSIMPVSCVN